MGGVKEPGPAALASGIRTTRPTGDLVAVVATKAEQESWGPASKLGQRI